MPSEETSGWTPSASRSLHLPVQGWIGSLANSVYRSTLRWPAMAPGDALDYSLDCARWLADAGDTITGLTIDVPRVSTLPGPVVKWATWYGSLIVLWIDGGTVGTIQPINLSFETAMGRVATIWLELPIRGGHSLIAPDGPDAPPGQSALPGTVVITNGSDGGSDGGSGGGSDGGSGGNPPDSNPPPVQTVLAVFAVPFADTIPRLITWETADGTAVAGADYIATEDGVLIPPGWGEVIARIPVPTRTQGAPSKTFDVIFKWYDKSQAPVGQGIGQIGGWPIYPVARQTVPVVIDDTTVAARILPACRATPTTIPVAVNQVADTIPQITLEGGTADNPDVFPLSQYRSPMTDIYIDNVGVNPYANMTLEVTSDLCTIINLGDWFPQFVTASGDHRMLISGTAKEICAAATMLQFRPTGTGTGTIVFTMRAQGSTAQTTKTYYVRGAASEMAFVNAPPDDGSMTISTNTFAFTNTYGVFAVNNSDPYLEMTLTIEPDAGGGEVVGLTSPAATRTPSGNGYVVVGTAYVLGVVLVPLAIYVGSGVNPPVTRGAHALKVTVSDGLNTITKDIHYNITY